MAADVRARTDDPFLIFFFSLTEILYIRSRDRRKSRSCFRRPDVVHSGQTSFHIAGIIERNRIGFSKYSTARVDDRTGQTKFNLVRYLFRVRILTGAVPRRGAVVVRRISCREIIVREVKSRISLLGVATDICLTKQM